MITIPLWWLYVLCGLAAAGTVAVCALLWVACYAIIEYLNEPHAPQRPQHRHETIEPPHWTPK